MVDNFFFKSVQIYIKDAECAESKEKSNSRFFLIFIFRVIGSHFCTHITPILDEFHNNSNNKIRKIDF